MLDEERDRLDEFLLAHGRSDDYVPVIRDALGECWKGETSLPLESSPASSETTSPTDGDTSSTEGLSSADTPETPWKGVPDGDPISWPLGAAG